MDGTVHPYYTVALAPAIAALVGISVAELAAPQGVLACRAWRLAAMLAVTGVWAFVLLNRTPDWLPALRWVVLVGSVIVAVLLAVGAAPARRATVGRRRGALPCSGSARTAAYSIETMSQAHSGPMHHVRAGKGGRFRLRRPWRQGGPAARAAPVGVWPTTPRWRHW